MEYNDPWTILPTLTHATDAITMDKVDMLKSKSNLDVIKSELSKLTGTKRHAMTMAVVEPDPADSLQRFKRGRKAFGSKTESRFVAASVQGIASAHCGAMQHLSGDTYFNRWPVKLIAVSELRLMDAAAYEKMFESVPCLHTCHLLVSCHLFVCLFVCLFQCYICP